MSSFLDLANQALQLVGTRTSLTQSELDNNSTNEAIQINLSKVSVRRRLLRMAPWNCSMRTAPLTLITSAIGTPENTYTGTNTWRPGLPIPPWNYEYQYPLDCLRMCFLLPVNSLYRYTGRPVEYKVETDMFRGVTAATVANAGSGYAFLDNILLAGTPPGALPIGTPVTLIVQTVNGSGGVLTASIISQVLDAVPPLGGSYFQLQSNPVGQQSTTGSGTGVTFNLTQEGYSPQRVVLTNLQNAMCKYVQDVTDTNLFDPSFEDAYVASLAAVITMALTGDHKTANNAIEIANSMIMEARLRDANEGLSINDITPDWIRTRGYNAGDPFGTFQSNFDWGALYPVIAG